MKIETISENFVKRLFPPKNSSSHKGDFGHTVAVGGSFRFVGAPLFASEAASCVCSLIGAGRVAMSVGAGLTTVALPDLWLRRFIRL